MDKHWTKLEENAKCTSDETTEVHANFKKPCASQENSSSHLNDCEQDWIRRVWKIDNGKGWGFYTQTNDGCQWTKLMLSIGLDKSSFQLQGEDLLNRQFRTYDDAELFFNLYAKSMGFSVRKSHKKTNTLGDITNRTWLCAKEGERDDKFLTMPNRKKVARSLTREGCQVRFRVNRDKSSAKWVVKQFVTTHSHPLAFASHIVFLPSNRHVTDGALQTAKSMRSAGIRTCHIMGYIAKQVGGYENVRFGIKDLYNRLGKENGPDVADADAAKALGYLQHKCEFESNFFGKYSLDADIRLENILWADTQSRADYKIFGHALAFDTTYRSNFYGKPFLVFVGVNHHFKTIIFAMALLADETIKSYNWALQTFLECMDGARPRTVIIDGDNAMRHAIKELMPENNSSTLHSASTPKCSYKH